MSTFSAFNPAFAETGEIRNFKLAGFTTHQIYKLLIKRIL